MKLVVQTCFVLLILVLSAGNGTCSEPHYPTIFGTSWLKAESFISENKSWMQHTCKKHNVDYSLASSIIFPELIRYSALRDKMEITLLKALYVNYGDEYANFSIGLFQIKPSCAEQILKDETLIHDKKLASHFVPIRNSLSIKERRSTIVKELEDQKKEFLYVVALIKILENKYSDHFKDDAQTKLRFFASAYNCGFNNTKEYIENHINIKSFHTGLVKGGNVYAYADIAEAFNKRFSIPSGNPLFPKRR